MVNTSTRPQAATEWVPETMRIVHTCAELAKDALQADDNADDATALAFPSSTTAVNRSSRRMWTPGSTLGVSFIGGSEEVRAKVKQYANLWTEHANIKFDFDAPGPAAIRVAFIDEVGSWSFLGATCELVPTSKPTMNLAWLHDAETSEETIASVVLHEFGHALGCVHEHTPNSRIPWNVPFVNDYYERTQGWTRVDVHRNIFAHYAQMRPSIRAAAFDSQSVMVYPIPSQFTGEQFSTERHARLSDMDKHTIQTMYTSPPVLFDAGSFHTLSIHSYDECVNENIGTVHFSRPLSATTPKLLLGLSMLDLEQGRNPRIACEVLSAAEDSARINLRSWGDTLHWASACDWLAISPLDSDCQHGVSTVAEHWERGVIPVHNSFRITFARPYSAIPRVAVWLTAIDAHCGYNLRCSVFATDVSPTGFTLHLDAWSDTRLYQLSATWLAHSADRPDICSGTIATDLNTPVIHPRKSFTGSTPFDGAGFARPPRVFMAFSHLDISNQHNLRVKAGTDRVSSYEMDYRIEAWSDSALYATRCAFVAVA